MSRSKLVLAVAVLALLAGCRSQGAVPPVPVASPEPTLQPDDLVNLTVYFRSASAPHLVPAVREVAVSDDLPRRALELLLAGPTPEEVESGEVAAPLPTTTEILGFSVDGDTALVDLSAHVVRDAAAVGASPANEALALAALAGTLTEFPAIDKVRLTVEGASSGWHGGVDVGMFWGGWGLPEVLVRDETLLGPLAREAEGLPDLALFGVERQEIGPDSPTPVAVSTVRLRSRSTYLRLTIEIADPMDADAPGPQPRARAHAAGDVVIVEIDGVTAYRAEVTAGQRLAADDPGFSSLGVEVTELPGTVRFLLSLSEPRPFALQNLSSPTRIVLDVKK